MPDPDKLRSLREALSEQERRLEELTPKSDSTPVSADHSVHYQEALVVTIRTVQMLIDMLSEVGL